jgi:hypothetical protein
MPSPAEPVRAARMVPLVGDGPAMRDWADELVARARTEGVELTGENGLLTALVRQVLQTGLEVELTDHLGYQPHAVAGRGSGNSRNGSYAKTVTTDVGPVDLRVPRDRNGSFDPVTVPKGQRRLDGLSGNVISLYAKGMTTGDIQAHLFDLYGTEISRDTISRITDAVVEDMVAWQNRPLDRVYPVILIDAITVKIRDGQVANRPVYVAMGVNLDGERDVLGLWVGPAGGEGAKFWTTTLTELRNRGVADCFIVCCDGLKGLPEAIRATWALADVQLSLVHDGGAWSGSGCHPHRRERASANRPPRSRCRPVPPVGDGLRTASRSCAASAITSDGGGLSTRVRRTPRRRSCPRSLASTGVPPTIKSPLSTTPVVSCSTRATPTLVTASTP